MPRTDPSRSVLTVTHFQNGADWRPASGRARLVAAGPLDGLHAGDFVEAVGWLSAPGEPANPGEFDPAGHYLDERITALLDVHKTSEGVVRLAEGWADAPTGWLAAVRGWGRRTLEVTLPPEQSGVAAALLLGDGSAMAQAEWDKYIRTGVIHALAISGQHLIILAAFLWLVLRLAGLPRKRGAWLVAIVLILYAALTGGRPPATRAAVMVGLICGGMILRRVVLPANAFALAWLIVLILQPTDLADAGCQLSFLCVAVLTWGVSRWLAPKPLDPFEQLIDDSRPAWLRGLRRVGRWAAVSYGITVVLGLTVVPLVAYRYHVITPIGFLIGPPVVFLAAIALVTGFLLLICGGHFPAVGAGLRLGDRLELARLWLGRRLRRPAPARPLARRRRARLVARRVLCRVTISTDVAERCGAWRRPLAFAGVGWLIFGLVADVLAVRCRTACGSRFSRSAMAVVPSWRPTTAGSSCTMPVPWRDQTSPAGRSPRFCGTAASVESTKSSFRTPTWTTSTGFPACSSISRSAR